MARASVKCGRCGERWETKVHYVKSLAMHLCTKCVYTAYRLLGDIQDQEEAIARDHAGPDEGK